MVVKSEESKKPEQKKLETKPALPISEFKSTSRVNLSSSSSSKTSSSPAGADVEAARTATVAASKAPNPATERVMTEVRERI